MDDIERGASETAAGDQESPRDEALVEYLQRRRRERHGVVYDSWRDVPRGLKTAGQWAEEDRRPLKGATSKVSVLVNALYRHPNARLYRLDQTEPYTPTPLEQAMRCYHRLFVKYAAKDDFIWLGTDGGTGQEVWNRCRPRAATADRPGNDFSPVNKDKARQHVLGKQVYGVVGGESTHFLAIDADLHTGRHEDGSKKYGDPEIFMRQVAVLVGTLHGRNGCHFQVKDGDAAGLHAVLVPGGRMRLDGAVKKLRAVLLRLDRRHPDLADAARRAGMKSIGEMELFPSTSGGFRLPLCRGRTMLLDRPLPLVYNRRLKRKVQDVEGYVAWLLDPNRHYMPADEVLTFLEDRLREGEAITAGAGVNAKEKKGKAPPDRPQRRKTVLTNRTADAIARLFEGRPDPDTPWRDMLPVLLRILWASGVGQDRAVETVLRRLEEIPDKGFSRTLADGDYGDIEDKLRRQAKTIWRDNGGQGGSALSAEKLRNSVEKWQAAGIDTANLMGFKTREEYGAAAIIPAATSAGSFGWGADELDDVSALADILKCPWETAGDVLLTLVRHVAGGAKPVSPAFFEVLLGALPVKIGRRNKQSALLGFMQDRGYWYKHSLHSQAAKRAARYALGVPGQDLLKRLSSEPHEHTH